MGQERDRIAEIARNIAEGGWSSIYDLVCMLTEEQLNEMGYGKEGEAQCEWCGEYFDEESLKEDYTGDAICEDCLVDEEYLKMKLEDEERNKV